MTTYRCPICQRATSLWRGVDVPGWQSVNDRLEPERIGHPDRDVEWVNAVPDGTYGCAECGWEGGEPEAFDPDESDEPERSLPEIHPSQMQLPTEMTITRREAP